MIETAYALGTPMNVDTRPLFDHAWPLIGVVHLPSLPGSPFGRLSMAEIRDHVAADVEALVSGGMDALIVENFGDHPFLPDEVEPHTVAMMALLVEHAQQTARRVDPDRPVPLGVNVLRNDARSGLAIAAATGARFIRVNVHCGAMVTDQGLINGKAWQTLRYRRSLGADGVAILADVFVKHAHPLGDADLESSAKDTFLRGGASALIISGTGTGAPADLERARRIKAVLPQAPVLIGSGLTAGGLEQAAGLTDGAIVGTALKRGGDVGAPVDVDRVRALVASRDRAVRAATRT